MLIAAFPKLKACISPGIHLSIPSLSGVSDTSFFFFFLWKKRILHAYQVEYNSSSNRCVRSSKQKNTVAWKRLRFRKSHLDLHGYIGLTSPINTVSLSFKMSF
jgi:hypothetical protein